jgi:hypothetical protein
MVLLAGPQTDWHWRLFSMRQSSSPVYHTWLVRLLSCTVTKSLAEMLSIEPMVTFKARTAGVDVSRFTTLREHTMDHTLTSKQKGEDENGDEMHLTLGKKGVEIMHQANLAEDREKSRRRGGVVIAITSVSVPRSRGRRCFACGGPRIMIIITRTRTRCSAVTS